MLHTLRHGLPIKEAFKTMASHVTYCPHNPDTIEGCAIEQCPCCGGLGVAARCPGCDGAGAILTRTKREAELAHGSQFQKCDQCKGRGWFPITVDLYDRLGFGAPPSHNYRILKRPPRRQNA
jgi:hypothetical protein